MHPDNLETTQTQLPGMWDDAVAQLLWQTWDKLSIIESVDSMSSMSRNDLNTPYI